MLNHQEDEELKRKQGETLRWFSAASTTIKDHERFRGIREDSAGNGSWILRNEKVMNWIELETPESSILWIHGIPGAGKKQFSASMNSNCMLYAKSL